MGCGCGGGKRAAQATQGTNPTNPIIFGDDDQNLPVKKVVLVQGSGGMPAGATRFARGSEVDAMIASGALRPIGG